MKISFPPGAIWWIVTFLLVWTSVIVRMRRYELPLYIRGGCWSILIALLAEATLRRSGYWESTRSIIAVFGPDLTLYLGPYLVQGLLFYRFMPPWGSWQVWYTVLSAFSAVTLEAGLRAVKLTTLGWSDLPQVIVIAVLRYFALLALYYGHNVAGVAEKLARQQVVAQQMYKRAKLAGHLWPVYMSAAWGMARITRLNLPSIISRRQTKS